MAKENKSEQFDPLLPGYSFNRYLVAGITPITEGGPLDFLIDRPHGMSGYIINMTVQGQGKIFQDASSFRCNPGDLLLFSPEAVHSYGRHPENTSWYHRWIYFRPRAYWANWLNWHRQVNSVGRFTVENKELIKEFEALFQQIEAVYKERRRYSEDLALNLLERLLIRCFEEMPENQLPAIDSRIEDACQFISEHLDQDLGLEEIARHVCLSPSRLTHLFREQMGVNLLRWREDQRIIRAKHMLQISRTPVARIARLVGYDDQLYFSRVFRKRVGVSPSIFRKENNNSDLEYGQSPVYLNNHVYNTQREE